MATEKTKAEIQAEHAELTKQVEDLTSKLAQQDEGAKQAAQFQASQSRELQALVNQTVALANDMRMQRDQAHRQAQALQKALNDARSAGE